MKTILKLLKKELPYIAIANTIVLSTIAAVVGIVNLGTVAFHSANIAWHNYILGL
jgi:hypothetical protein